MLRITKNHFFGIDAPKLDINILQYNYYCGIKQWDNRNVVAPFWYFWRNEHSGAGIECGTRKKNITAGTIVLIPPNTVFSTTSAPTPFNQLYIHFTVDEPLCPVRL